MVRILNEYENKIFLYKLLLNKQLKCWIILNIFQDSVINLTITNFAAFTLNKHKTNTKVKLVNAGDIKMKIY